MLKYLPLLWSNLRRKPVRTGLTIASIAVAFLLFGVLEAFRSALSAGVDFAGQDRLVTINKVTLIQPLPRSYFERVRSVPGVTVATTQDWFGGIYQEDRNTVTAFSVVADTFFQTFPEIELDEAQKRAFLGERTGAIVGKTLAAQYGWKVGQTIPLRSNIWVKKDGGNTWDMKIVGIYDSDGDTNTLYFNYEYFNETRDEFTRDNIGQVVFRIADPDRAADIARTIDALFANSSTETKTTTERAFTQAFVNQIGDVGSIVVAVSLAVFFTMLLVAANTMGQSVRERTNELAVMKTVGFSSVQVMLLVLSESLLITGIGGGIGLALAFGAVAAIGTSMQQFLPFSGVPSSSYGPAVGLIVVIGLLAGTLPCVQAFQLRITEALRRG